MGTLRGDNGEDRTPDGGGLPDLPPEWGTIVIPDDAAELAHEAARVRRELRRAARGARWRRRLHLPPKRVRDEDSPALGLPLMIMAVAIVATMTSLFALTWPSKNGQVSTPANASPGQSHAMGRLPDIALADTHGTPVKLRGLVPAVILLVDGCDCTKLVDDTVAAAPTSVTVVAVSRSPESAAPAPPAPSTSAEASGRARLFMVVDPSSELRTTFASTPPAGGVVAILVNGAGDVTYEAAPVTKVDDFRTRLTALR